MSDEEHHFDHKGESRASKTFPQQAGTIRKNGDIVTKGRPCKEVMDVETRNVVKIAIGMKSARGKNQKKSEKLGKNWKKSGRNRLEVIHVESEEDEGGNIEDNSTDHEVIDVETRNVVKIAIGMKSARRTNRKKFEKSGKNRKKSGENRLEVIDVESEEDEGGTIGDNSTDHEVIHVESEEDGGTIGDNSTDHVVGDIEREEDEGGTIGDTFTDYRPSKLSIRPPHPDPVVETSSLSAVQPPEHTYELKIAEEMEKSSTLSTLQLETIIYASQRHSQRLPDGKRAGFLMGDGAGVGKGRTIAGLIWENWQHGRRKAVWLSVSPDLKSDARRDLDDVGATCVEVHALNKLPYSKLDSKSVGVTEGVIFLTYSSLIASSGEGLSRLQQLVNWCGPENDGLLVFDECHKAKNLVPESGRQVTSTGEAVRDIQLQLPEARVVYCSATAASEPRNMAYMVRLGLWGPGTCFPQFESFLEALEKRGVGALELVAMDMKARGMYVCRQLSFKGAEFEVVEVPLEADMREMYKNAARLWADLRAELLKATKSLSEERPNSSPLWRLYWASHQRFFRYMCMSAKVPAVVKLAKQALSEDKCVVIGLQSTGEARTEEAVTKYGAELDDFVSGSRELLLKFVEDNYPLPQQPVQMPEEGVKESGRKRHVAPTDTSFKGRMRKAARCKAPSDAEADGEYETKSEPESTDSDKHYQIFETTKMVLQCSSCGKSMHSPQMDLVEGDWSCPMCKKQTEVYIKSHDADIAELWKRYKAAKERKNDFLENIRGLVLPCNPLDDIIHQIGGPNCVAEMTGRRRRLVRDSSRKGVVYQARNTKDVSMEKVNMHEKHFFMDGTKLVAVISEAASAGVSLQADRRAKNQKRRVHITLELPWSADRAIQQFGRTHRSNQACAPEYRLLFTNLGGECRFASIVAKRLESLGALTQGDRRAGPSLSAYNFDSVYGKRALHKVYKAIFEQSDHSLDREALKSAGIIGDAIPGRKHKNDMNDVGRFLNRILGLAPDIQNRIFNYFISILNSVVQDAHKEGDFDSGIVDIKANLIKLKRTKTVYKDPMSGASTTLSTLKIDHGMTFEAASGLLDKNAKIAANQTDDGFYESKQKWLGRKHFLLAIECPTRQTFKIFRPASGEARSEMTHVELHSKYERASSVEKLRVFWQKEFQVSAEQCMHGPKCKAGASCTIGKRIKEFNILGGLILPVWGIVEESLSKQARQSHRRLRVVCLETTSDKQRIVGLHIPTPEVKSVLQDLSLSQNPGA